jgi:hypothetical protein
MVLIDLTPTGAEFKITKISNCSANLYGKA